MTADNNIHAVAFTGHRKERILQGNTPDIIGHIELAIAAQVAELYGQGYRTFYCGMAGGFDMLAATAVIRMKAVYKDFRLVAIVPFRNQSARYDDRTSSSTTLCLKQPMKWSCFPNIISEVVSIAGMTTSSAKPM